MSLRNTSSCCWFDFFLEKRQLSQSQISKAIIASERKSFNLEFDNQQRIFNEWRRNLVCVFHVIVLRSVVFRVIVFDLIVFHVIVFHVIVFHEIVFQVIVFHVIVFCVIAGFSLVETKIRL